MTDSSEQQRFTLLIDSGQLDELRALADENHRSVGAEIRLAIRARLKDFEAQAERKAA